MKTLLLLASLSWAATPGTSAQSVSDWLKLYTLTPYSETWNVVAHVKSLKGDLPKVMSAVEAKGGTLAVPLANSISSSDSQQLVYKLPLSKAAGALKDLEKAAHFGPPQVRAAGEKLPLAEIEKKIDILIKERDANQPALMSMPATASLIEGVLGHLVAARGVAKKSEGDVTLNLTVQEAPKK